MARMGSHMTSMQMAQVSSSDAEAVGIAGCESHQSQPEEQQRKESVSTIVHEKSGDGDDA